MKARIESSLPATGRYFFVPAIMLALIICGVAAAFCQGGPATLNIHVNRQETNAGKPLDGRSVYQLNSDWTTDDGKTIRLIQLRGKPQVVAMFFASCRGACPLLVHEMKQVADSLPADVRTNVGFLLVSFDSDRDTPDALRAYRSAQELPGSQWTLLHGKPGDVRELALVLGVKYRQDGSGQFSHSNVITLLDGNGDIAYQQNGLDASGEELARQLNRLLK